MNAPRIVAIGYSTDDNQGAFLSQKTAEPGAQATEYWKSTAMLGKDQIIKRTAVLTGEAPAAPNHFSNCILRLMNDFPTTIIQAEYILYNEIMGGRFSKNIDPVLWPVLDISTTP